MWNRLAFVLNRLPHARSRYVVVVAQFAERIPQHSTQPSPLGFEAVLIPNLSFFIAAFS